MTKEQTTLCFDREYLSKIREEAEKDERTLSFVVNKIIKKHYQNLNN